MRKPNPTAIYYSKEKRRYDYPSKSYICREGENGTLWSMGTYPTKIRVKDLPDYYICVYLYGGYKYLRATNIKDMIYKPNMWVNHFLRDDALYISYNQPLELVDTKWGGKTCENYDIALYGNDIMTFVAAAKYYSNYDTAAIEQAIKDKWEYFCTKYPEELEHFPHKTWHYDPAEYDEKVRENKLWRVT